VTRSGAAPATGDGVDRWFPVGDQGRPTVVLVHGSFSGSWTWEKVGPYLASRGWPVVAANWRAHAPGAGQDVQVLVGTTVEDLVADLAELLAALDGPYVVVAHSIGAVVALGAAGEVATRPGAMALVCPAPPLGAGDGYGPAPTRDLGVPVAAPSAEAAGALFFHRLAPVDLDRYAGLLTAESACVLAQVSAGYPVDPATVTYPVLVIEAQDDQLQPPAAGIDRAVAEWAGAELVVLEDAGHFVPVEAGWQRLAVRLDDWLGTTVEARV
jgi:pimeloyl-ACP methyl ester carboxylesterase